MCFLYLGVAANFDSSGSTCSYVSTDDVIMVGKKYAVPDAMIWGAVCGRDVLGSVVVSKEKGGNGNNTIYRFIRVDLSFSHRSRGR